MQNWFKNLIFFLFLGDFPVNRFLRQFNLETNCCNLGTIFHQDLQCNDILYVLKTELLSLQLGVLFHSLSERYCLHPRKFFLKFPIFCSFINPKIFRSVFWETIFWKIVKCLWHTLFSVFELWQISKKYPQQLINSWLQCFDLLTCLQKPSPYIWFQYDLQKKFEVFGNVWLVVQVLYTMSWFVGNVLLPFLINHLIYSSFE